MLFGLVIQLGLAAFLLFGVASLTGVIQWGQVARYVPWAARLIAPEPPVRPDGPTQTGEKSMVESAFEAVPAPRDTRGKGPGTTQPHRSSSRERSCGIADSARIRELEREYGWDRQVLGLISCGQIRRGFTVEQLRASLGSPGSVVRRESGQESWVYAGFSVTVRDGVVVGLER